MTYEVGDRLIVGNDTCTVKYVGEIPRWPCMMSYGVEWDDPKRGKNSGTFADKSYFKTIAPNSGSFIKGSKLNENANTGVSITQALGSRYEHPLTKLDDVLLGTKKIEAIGLQELNNRSQDLKNLETLFLDHCAINEKKISEEELGAIREKYVRVTHLDLSYNLLSNFEASCKLFSAFSNLESLDISRNIFMNGWDCLENVSFPKVKSLTISGSQLTIEQLKIIFRCFPSLKVLVASWNRLSDLDEGMIDFPHTLRELTLSGNAIKHVPRNLFLFGLRSLNVSHNLLTGFDSFPAPSLESLDISYNCIREWTTLDLLNCNFSELKSLRLDNNPLNSNLEDTFTFYSIISRFEKIEVLDGSLLSKDTRNESEIFFISKVLDGEIDYNKKLLRWKKLLEKFPLKRKEPLEEKGWLDGLIIRVHVSYENRPTATECVILSNYTVRHLKTIIAQKFLLDVLKFRVYHVITSDARREMDHEFRAINYYDVCDSSMICVENIENHQ